MPGFGLWPKLRYVFQNYLHSPAREQQELARWWAQVREAWEASPVAQISPVAVADQLATPFANNQDLFPVVWEWILDFILTDGLLKFPSVDFTQPLSFEECGALRQDLQRRELFIKNPALLERWAELIFNTFAGILDYLPASQAAGGTLLTVPLIDRLTHPAEVLDCILFTIINRQGEDTQLFSLGLKYRLKDNLCWASGLDPEQKSQASDKFKLPSELGKAPLELVDIYCTGTPFEGFFKTPLPFSIPLASRFEHTLLLASSGWGKTETLKRLMVEDLQQGYGFAVIDSQMDLIDQILRLKHDRHVILIDPADVEYPIAFNLFDVDISTGSASDREAIMNGIIATYEYIFGGLFGAEFTLRQKAMFGYIARLLLFIPKATIFTLKDLFEDGEQYSAYMQQLDGIAREYFEKQFFQKKLAPVKEQVLDRLYALLENPTFARMFNQEDNRLDLFAAMNHGAIILISTAKSHLQGELFRIFGKFFIGMLTQAALKRQLLPPAQRTPFFCYIDEAAEYFTGDVVPVETLINQARKYRVGLLLTLQHTEQMSDRLRATVLTSTSIKFVGGVNEKDERSLAKEMRVDPAYVQQLRKHEGGADWAVWVRNQGTTKVFVPFGGFQALPKRNSEEYEEFIRTNRETYCTPIQHAPPPAPAPAVEDDDFLE
jgi:hypothetical protein